MGGDGPAGSGMEPFGKGVLGSVYLAPARAPNRASAFSYPIFLAVGAESCSSMTRKGDEGGFDGFSKG